MCLPCFALLLHAGSGECFESVSTVGASLASAEVKPVPPLVPDAYPLIGPFEVDAVISTQDEAERFGASIALSGDTVLVGAFMTYVYGWQSGAAFIFVQDGLAWTQQARIVPPSGTDWVSFGESVALVGDTAIIGASGDHQAGNGAGAIYVYHRSGTDWLLQDTITASDATVGQRFGISVVYDGTTLAVGALSDDEGGDSAGAVYVFEPSGTSFVEVAKLLPGDGGHGTMGLGLSLSGDTLAAGAILHDGTTTDAGAVYVFRESGGTWTQEAVLRPQGLGSHDQYRRLPRLRM